MAFKKGDDPNRNIKGRPIGSKTSDIRNVLAKELAQQIHGDTIEIVQILIAQAKLHKEWAIKLYVNGILPYVLGKPKAEVDDEGVDNSEIALSVAKAYPREVIDKIRELMTGVEQ
jgi:hypothetical protein